MSMLYSPSSEGSKIVARFRSPQEFIPHAYWLITDRGENRSNCKCKYCAKRPQREVTDAFGLSSSQRQGPSPSGTARVPTNFGSAARKREKQQVPHLTVRRAPRIPKLPKAPTQFVAPEREGDLRRALGKYQQWARESELVWVKLNHPIAWKNADTHPEEVIVFWPGIVEEISFKSEIRPKESDVVMKDISNGDAKHDIVGNSAADEDVPWTVRHKWVYKIQLLVVSKVMACEDDRLLPYQSYAPSENLLRAIRSVKIDVDSYSGPVGMSIITASGDNEEEDAETKLSEAFARFDPSPPSPQSQERHFEEAAGPFAMAIQIASCISRYWTPTHTWECKLLEPRSILPSGSVSTPVRNAPSERELQNSSTSGGEATPEFNNQQPSKLRQAFGIESQLRFQGLWWGAERIWMGELVRLKFPRYQFAPKGAANIKQPSGSVIDRIQDSQSLPALKVSNPGKPSSGIGAQDEQEQINESAPHPSTKEIINMDNAMEEDSQGPNLPEQSSRVKIEVGSSTDAMDMDGESDGAASRGIFMRIDGIFLARATRGRGSGNECRLTGMLYELADENWESGDEADTYGKPSVAGKANGKPIATPLTLLNLSSGKPTLTQGTNYVAPQAATAPVPSTQALLSVDQNTLPSVSSASDNAGDLPMASSLTTSDSLSKDKIENTVISSENALLPSGSSDLLLPSEDTKGKQREAPLPPSIPQKFNPGNPSLSSPLSPFPSSYPLPSAPQTYKFRPILKPSFEADVSLTLLSGRYYPGILQKPLMKPYVTAASQNPEASGNDAYWALECLDAGVYNAVDPTTRVASRWEMIRRAEAEAKKELVDYWRNRALRQKDAIDVDVD